MDIKETNLLSTKQLDLEAVQKIMAVADEMQPYASRRIITPVLQGAILANLFFEPSTRTRISFGVAFNRLGGSVRDTTGVDMTSIKKGESMADTMRVISGYADIITIRHPQSEAVAEAAKVTRVPMINGGDGTNEHPTQALVDAYTMIKKIGSLDNLKIAMVGDLKFGRTVHSLSYLLSLFHNIQFAFVAPEEIQMPQSVQDYILSKNNGHRINRTSELLEGIKDADVIYMTRIQEERFSSPTEFNKFRGKYSLNKKNVEQNCKKDVIIMHPLPRDSRPESNELDVSLDDYEHLAIFDQTDNGIPVRMALFALILGVEDKVNENSREVKWFRKF